MDEVLAANDDHESSKKRKYPEPCFAVERSGPAGGRGSYTIAFKLKAAAFTRRGPVQRRNYRSEKKLTDFAFFGSNEDGVQTNAGYAWKTKAKIENENMSTVEVECQH